MEFLEAAKAASTKIAGRTVAVWGTGFISAALSESLSAFFPVAFYISDTDGAECFCEKPVYRSKQVGLSPVKNFIVVLADQKHREVREALQTAGFAEDSDYIDFKGDGDSVFKYKYEHKTPSRVAYWDTPIDCGDESYPEDIRFRVCGQNSGNLVHWHALKKNLNMHSYGRLHCSAEAMSGYDTLVVSALIYIRRDDPFNWASFVMQLPEHLAVVPISVGLASDNRDPGFRLHKNVLRILKNISQRCVSMGVRGEYTAEILAKHGIKNTRVIGCPSLYYPFLTRGSMDIARSEEPLRVVANASGGSDVWLDYIAGNKFAFVDQSLNALGARTDYAERKFFMDVKKWETHVGGFNFSIGTRFHGNVIALWSGIPALFIVHDSRMREMCELFKLPSIELDEFDSRKPVRHYYEAAYYSEFNKAMPKLLENYKTFLTENNLAWNGVKAKCVQ